MKTLLHRVNGLYAGLLLISFITIIVCVVLQIISRYGFNQPFTWTEEISLFAFCWFTFVGGAICSWEKSHLEVDFFYNRAGLKLQKYADICILALVTGLSLFLIVDSVITMKAQVGITSVAVRLPILLYTLAILVGFLGIAVFSAYHLKARITGEDQKRF